MYVHFVILLHSLTDKVKSRQISNILRPGFLMNCKNGFHFAKDRSKSQKINDTNIELELYNLTHKSYWQSLHKMEAPLSKIQEELMLWAVTTNSKYTWPCL